MWRRSRRPSRTATGGERGKIAEAEERAASSNRPRGAGKEEKMDMKVKLSTLWIFVALNYLYCGVASLVDPELLPQYLKGNVDGLEFSPGFLLAAGVLVEIFIAVVLLSRVLSYRANRRANIAAGSIMTAVQAATLFVGYQRRTTPSSALLRLRLLYSLSGMRGIGGSLSLRSSYTTRSSSQFAEEGQKRGAGRKGEVSENTLHRWRNQYGGWKVSSRSREKR